MEEKKPIKIKFKTAVILIIIGVILLGVFGANVYASANGYGNIFLLIKYMITGENIKTTDKNQVLIEDDNEEIFSEEEVRAAYQKYLDLVGAKWMESHDILIKLDLIKEKDIFDFKEAKTPGYSKTNIKYSDFKEKMLNYVTEKCFENDIIILDSVEHKAYIDEDGYLCCANSGSSGGDYKVQSITKINDKQYEAKVIHLLEEGSETINYNFGIENNNGRCVINYCNQIVITETILTKAEAKEILEKKYKNVENMWLNVTDFFKTDLGKEVKNFEGIVLSYGTEKFLNQVKNNLPWGMYMENGKYFIEEGWGGDISYEGLKDFENIKITDSSITATVITKQQTYNGNDWVPDKDRKSEFILIKSGNKWLVDYFDFKDIFENGDTISENSKTEYEKAEEAIKNKLLDKNWLKENTLIKSNNGNSSSIDEQDYKFAVIKEQNTQNPVVVLVVTAEQILTKNTFVIRYKNNDVSIEKVSEGHYQHTDTLTNGEYYATTYTHMNEWAYELLEVSSDDIGVVDRNHGTIRDEDYDYMEVLNFENNNNLKYVTTELNESNLNRLLKNQNNIITQLSPSGFAGSSLKIVELNSNKEVYLITLSDANDRNNIASKELIAKNVDTISKSSDGDITVKGGDRVKSAPNWIHFEQ